MFVLCHHDFCALSRVSCEDTAMTLLLKYAEWNGDFTSIDKSILSNCELWRCSSQWAICTHGEAKNEQLNVGAVPPHIQLSDSTGNECTMLSSIWPFCWFFKFNSKAHHFSFLLVKNYLSMKYSFLVTRIQRNIGVFKFKSVYGTAHANFMA